MPGSTEATQTNVVRSTSAAAAAAGGAANNATVRAMQAAQLAQAEDRGPEQDVAFVVEVNGVHGAEGRVGEQALRGGVEVAGRQRRGRGEPERVGVVVGELEGAGGLFFFFARVLLLRDDHDIDVGRG